MGRIINLITNNPYRVLGVYSNDSLAARTSNESKMKAFLKVGRNVEFPLDLKGLLPTLSRTEELVAKAKSDIALPDGQIKYAQFWFIKSTPIDDIAFNHLTAGDLDGAYDTFAKKDSMSSLQNRLVCAVIKEDYRTAANFAQRLYSGYNAEFCSALGFTSIFSTEELVSMFVESLSDSGVNIGLLSGFTSDATWNNVIAKKSTQPIIDSLKSALSDAQKSKGKGPAARFQSGKKLMAVVKIELPKLAAILPKSDIQYQVLADDLAEEILQCGIDYFNDSEAHEAAHNAMTLQKYASTIAVGSVTKDRCKENVTILKKIIDNLPPQEVASEHKFIINELEKFCKLPDKIDHSITLLNNTKPKLQAIRAKLGPTNSYYLKISTQVAGNALHNLIEEVNITQKFITSSAPSEKFISLLLLKDTLEKAWRATRIMDSFDMEPDFKTRYRTNRTTLKDMYDQVEAVTSPSTTPSYTPTHGSSNDDNSGCWVVGVIILIIVFLVNMC